MSTGDNKDTNRVAGGYKAAVHNPRVSDEAKEHAMERLQAMGADADNHGQALSAKDTVTDFEEDAEEYGGGVTRRSARRQLVDSDYDSENARHEANVTAGYKATLNNPRVSEAAKQHAREVLQDKGEPI